MVVEEISRTDEPVVVVLLFGPKDPIWIKPFNGDEALRTLGIR